MSTTVLVPDAEEQRQRCSISVSAGAVDFYFHPPLSARHAGTAVHEGSCVGDDPNA